MSFQAVPNRETKKLDFKLGQRKCLHLYHYLIHPVFGFMNARIQTWFPSADCAPPSLPKMATSTLTS